MSADDSIPVGVVIERREIDNPWQDYTWSPVAVISGTLPPRKPPFSPALP